MPFKKRRVMSLMAINSFRIKECPIAYRKWHPMLAGHQWVFTHRSKPKHLS